MKVNNMAYRRAFLEQMPTHELDEMLRKELHKENIDDDLVRLLLRVLEEREREYPLEDDEAVAAAVEKYTAYVNSVRTTPARPARRWNGVLKVASILVVVGLLFFVVPQVARAEGIFEMLARWTESVFEFFSPGEVFEQPEYAFETDHPGLQQIYDAVVELGITDPVVPMWVPEGYELVNLQKQENFQEGIVYAELRYDKKWITVHVSVSNKGDGVEYYKDKSTVISYEYNEITHFIMRNLEKQVVAWNLENIVCTIAVDCQEDALFEILKSIYIMEAY